MRRLPNGHWRLLFMCILKRCSPAKLQQPTSEYATGHCFNFEWILRVATVSCFFSCCIFAGRPPMWWSHTEFCIIAYCCWSKHFENRIIEMLRYSHFSIFEFTWSGRGDLFFLNTDNIFVYETIANVCQSESTNHKKKMHYHTLIIEIKTFQGCSLNWWWYNYVVVLL